MAPPRSLFLLTAVLAMTGCGRGHSPEVDTDAPTTVTVSSPSFVEGGELPARFTCDGEEISPPLEWSDGPAEAWALVVDDPDAPGGSYVHWVVLDLPAATTSLGSGKAPAGAVQAVNSSGDPSYAGPCPPSGEHRYRFTVYALAAPTGLAEGASLGSALDAIGDGATARGTITAVYSRR